MIEFSDPAGVYFGGYYTGGPTSAAWPNSIEVYVSSGDATANATLVKAYHLKGQLVDQAHQPISGLDVWIALNSDGTGGVQGAYVDVKSDNGGNYSLVVPAGTYRLGVQDLAMPMAYASGFVTPSGIFWDLAEATPITVVNSDVTVYVTVPPAPHVTGRITSASNGEPIVSAVSFCTDAGAFSTTSAADGTYSVAVVPSIGKVEFSQYCDGTGGWYSLSGWTRQQAQGTTLRVAATGDTTDIDVRMPWFYPISGTVTANGAAASGIEVDVYNAVGFYAYTTTNSLGQYSINLAGPDVYTFGFFDPSGAYASGWYGASGFVPGSNAAKPVDGGPIDITLPPALWISGRATLAGSGAAGALVEVWLGHDNYLDTQTASDGAFAVPVAPGTYTLWVSQPGGSAVGGWYRSGGRTYDWSAATPIVVSTTTVVVNIALGTGKQITGKVTANGVPLAGVFVVAYSGTSEADFSTTDSKGAYKLNVAAGTYTLYEGGSDQYLSGWRKTTGFGFYQSQASPLSVSSNVSNANFTVPPAYRIGGTVSAQGGAGLHYIYAEAFLSGVYYSDMLTGWGGEYSLLVPAGTYEMGFYDPNAEFGDGWYSASGVVRHFGDADDVVVSNADRPGIDIALVVMTVPSAPTNAVAFGFDSGAIISWDATPYDGWNDLLGYTVTASPGGAQCFTTGALFCSLDGLQNGTPYTFTVVATNGIGDSQPSTPASATPTAVPAPPTAVTGVGADSKVTVSWTASESSSATGYVVTSHPDQQQCTSTGALTCTVTGLTNGQVYTFTVAATSEDAKGPDSGPSAPVKPLFGYTYHPIDPVRVIDTRIAQGFPGKLVARTPQSCQITGLGAIPLGAMAVTANVTIVQPSAAASVYMGPDQIAYPLTATINFNKGDTTAYGSTLALNAGGQVSATYMASSGTTNLVVDITGYFTPDLTGDTYHPLTPARLLDTRSGNGLAGAFKANIPRTFAVAGRGGVPIDAKAVTGNLTVTNESSSWAAYIGPVPIAKPGASTINFVKGQVRANSLTVALGPGGTLSATFLARAGSTTHLVFDVTGYYSADLTGARYMPISPETVLDTRSGSGIGLTGKFVAGTPRTVTTLLGVPTSAVGVTGNISVYNQASWAVFVGPTPIAKPSTSALNFVKGDNCSNGFTVAVSDTESLSVTYLGAAGATANIVVYITGYFVP
jgi:hypothetical protein